METVQKIMDRAIAEKQVAGINLLVNKDGREYYFEAGMADIENEVPYSRDTITRLYSQTKPVTAAAVMLLWEQGEMDLAQPVADFLPAFRVMKVVNKDGSVGYSDRPIRICDLLNMTSGLSYPGKPNASSEHSGVVFDELVGRLNTENEMTTQEFAERMAEGPLAYVPGTSWEYGTSADILGALVEVISCKRFSEFLQDEFFAPLSMKDTGFYVPDEKQNRLGKVYETLGFKAPHKLKLYDGNNLGINNAADHLPAFESGGAGLHSTVDDYMKFAQMLLHGGEYEGGRLLKKKTVEYFTTRQLFPCGQAPFDEWGVFPGFSYGNMMRVSKWPELANMHTYVGEYGWDGWLGAHFANFPEQGISFIMGVQKKDAGTFDLSRKLRNAVLTALN